MQILMAIGTFAGGIGTLILAIVEVIKLIRRK